MIACMRGNVVEYTANAVVVDVQGIGYALKISSYTARHVKHNEPVTLWTHLHISDNAHTLYGFHDKEEKGMFNLLCSVAGLGPSTALIILSVAKPDEVKKNTMRENLHFFQGIKGVGKKTAQRIILELKDRLQKGTGEGEWVGVASTLQEEAMAALEALGFSRTEARKNLQRAVTAHETDALTLEGLIKSSLKQPPR